MSTSDAKHAVIHDILAEKYNMQDYHGVNDIPGTFKKSVADAIDSLYCFEADAASNPTEVWPVAIWSVAASNNGLKRRLKIPAIAEEHGYMRYKDTYCTTVTTAGNLSCVHVDQFGFGSLLLLLFGTKMWPPTEKNLMWLKENDSFSAMKRVRDTLNQLDFGGTQISDFESW
jgi:hypothetical protein